MTQRPGPVPDDHAPDHRGAAGQGPNDQGSTGQGPNIQACNGQGSHAPDPSGRGSGDADPHSRVSSGPGSDASAHGGQWPGSQHPGDPVVGPPAGVREPGTASAAPGATSPGATSPGAQSPSAAAPPGPPGPPDAAGRRVLGVAAIVLLAQTALTSIVPVIAPFARALGIAEWQMGLVISVAALCIVLTGPRWGRAAQRWGPKRVLAVSLGNGILAMVAFALVAQAGLAGALSVLTVVGGLIASRGVWFGLSEAALVPTAQTYVASLTDSREARVRGMASIGAAQGVSMLIGPAAGGLLGGISLMAPVWASPGLLAAALLIVLIGLPARRGAATDPTARVSPLDRRVLPYLVVSFGMFTVLGFVDILIGFVAQDRLGQSPERTALTTGLALVAAGVGLVLSQTVIVRLRSWSPRGLMLVGAIVAALGFAGLVPDLGAVGIFGGVFLAGIGVGMASPGAISGATLVVGRAEQGSIAGLIAAVNALTIIVAPLLATVLYGFAPAVPLLLGTAAALAIAGFVWASPRLRRDGAAHAGEAVDPALAQAGLAQDGGDPGGAGAAVD